MKIFAALLSALCIVLYPKVGSGAGNEFDFPRLPGAALLIGSVDPFFVAVTTTDQTWRILPESSQPETRDAAPIYPSISRDGTVIAAARLKVGGYPRQVAVAIYSTPEKKWTEYARGDFAGAIAISPDASKLAFPAAPQLNGSSGDDHLHIVDLKTGKETIGPETAGFGHIFASWSPDSRRLAYTFRYEIRIWDASTGKIARVADGVAPAWSPSGEWIAYLQGGSRDDAGTRCVQVHPDGSKEKVLVQLPKERGFVGPPVWSPDSRTILLNELADIDKWTMDIHLLDVGTLRMKRVFKDQLPVFGWAEAKQK